MKKNTIIQFIVTGMFLFGATACTGNFEDYNKNPHEPDQNDMGVDWYLVRSLASRSWQTYTMLMYCHYKFYQHLS